MPRKKERAETDRQLTCPNSACGFVFSRPLKVRNLCVQDSEAYDACPRCLGAIMTEDTASMNGTKSGSKLNLNEPAETGAREEGTRVERTESLSKAQCAHHFGYLSERRKNEKIPDECVVCENIVKCMLKTVTG